VYPWVVDDASLAGELADLGVTGIITDDPAATRSALERHR
jgi:glycerophosphoryl diester phosphodiesterase